MSSAKRIFFGVIIGGILLALIVLCILTFQIKAHAEVLLENTKVLHNRVAKLETKVISLETELSTHKTMTQIHFESNWRSIARMNNNFKALGTGYHLEEKNIAPDEYAYKEE